MESINYNFEKFLDRHCSGTSLESWKSRCMSSNSSNFCGTYWQSSEDGAFWAPFIGWSATKEESEASYAWIMAEGYGGMTLLNFYNKWMKDANLSKTRR